jgi:hypothetical protein
MESLDMPIQGVLWEAVSCSQRLDGLPAKVISLDSGQFWMPAHLALPAMSFQIHDLTPSSLVH